MLQPDRLSMPQLVAMLVASAAIGAVIAVAAMRSNPAPAHAAVIHSSEQAGDSATKETGKQRMGRPVVHFEIGCRDTAKTKAFYSKLFDWQMQGEGMSSTIQTTPGKGIDGHITALGHDPQHYVTVYVEVDDVKAYLEKATVLGGKTVVPPISIPTGKFAWFSDPDGNIIALLQPKKSQ